MNLLKKKRQNEEDNGYDNGYSGFADGYEGDYVGSDFGEEVGETVPFTEPVAVDPEPEAPKAAIKLVRFTTPAEREKVAECLRDGSAVIFDLDGLDRSDWYRVIDYIQGANFVLGGTISRFSENSLIEAPKNFDVSKLELDDLAEEEEEAASAEAEAPEVAEEV